MSRLLVSAALAAFLPVAAAAADWPAPDGRGWPGYREAPPAAAPGPEGWPGPAVRAVAPAPALPVVVEPVEAPAVVVRYVEPIIGRGLLYNVPPLPSERYTAILRSRY